MRRQIPPLLLRPLSPHARGETAAKSLVDFPPPPSLPTYLRREQAGSRGKSMCARRRRRPKGGGGALPAGSRSRTHISESPCSLRGSPYRGPLLLHLPKKGKEGGHNSSSILCCGNLNPPLLLYCCFVSYAGGGGRNDNCPAVFYIERFSEPLKDQKEGGNHEMPWVDTHVRGDGGRAAVEERGRRRRRRDRGAGGRRRDRRGAVDGRCRCRGRRHRGGGARADHGGGDAAVGRVDRHLRRRDVGVGA